MATGWLAGTVKEVPSGDTLVVASSKGHEKRLTLASLIAPRLVGHTTKIAASSCRPDLKIASGCWAAPQQWVQWIRKLRCWRRSLTCQPVEWPSAVHEQQSILHLHAGPQGWQHQGRALCLGEQGIPEEAVHRQGGPLPAHAAASQVSESTAGARRPARSASSTSWTTCPEGSLACASSGHPPPRMWRSAWQQMAGPR